MLKQQLLRPGPAAPVTRRCSLQVIAAKQKPKQQKSKSRWQKPKQPATSPVYDSYPANRSVDSLESTGMGLMDALLGLLPGAMKQKFETAMEAITDTRVPAFEKEFAAASSSGGLGLSAKQCAAVQARVNDAHLTARMMPVHMMTLQGDRADIPEELLVMRLGAQLNSEESFMTFLRAEPGTVLPKKAPIKYDKGNVGGQSFSNTPCEHVHLLPGSTHVAVGFADLGEFATAVSRWEEPTAAIGPAQLMQEPARETQGEHARDEKQGQGKQRQPRQGKQTRRSQQQQQQQQQLQQQEQQQRQSASSSMAELLARAHRLNASASLVSDSSSDGSGLSPVLASTLWPLAIVAGQQQQQQQQQQLQQQQPLTWVGFDASPYAVAKAAVLLEMMRQGADIDAVLQVWFSSAWASSTKAAFFEALASVLSSSNPTNSSSSSSSSSSSKYSPAVIRLLQHWQQKPDVTLAQSRSAWLKRVTKTGAYLGGFTRQQDRLAMTRYMFTGELLTAEVGSTVMCSLPRGAAAMAPDECFLATLGLPDLASQWVQEASPDVVAAGLAVWRKRLVRLAELLRQGAVVAEVQHDVIQISNTSATQAISSLKPVSMSWSNVPDYMVMDDFHQLAQECSAPATIHFMHSMNWVREVKMACHVDLLLMKQHMIEAISQGKVRGPKQLQLEAMQEAMDQALDLHLMRANIAIQDDYASAGVDKLLLCNPPVDNPRNIADYDMHRMFYEEWVTSFVQAAEQAAQGADPDVVAAIAQKPRNTGKAGRWKEGPRPVQAPLTHATVLQGPTHSPFHRTAATFFLAFVQYGQ